MSVSHPGVAQQQLFLRDVQKCLSLLWIQSSNILFWAGCWGPWQWTVQGRSLWKLQEVCSCHGSSWCPQWQSLLGSSVEQASGDHNDTHHVADSDIHYLFYCLFEVISWCQGKPFTPAILSVQFSLFFWIHCVVLLIEHSSPPRVIFVHG